MKKNMGSLDKTLRAVIGILILVIGYITESWWGLIGLIPLLTSLVGFCPVYVPFSLSTLKTDKK